MHDRRQTPRTDALKNACRSCLAAGAFALLACSSGAIAAPGPKPAADVNQPVAEWITLGTNSGPIPNPERAEPANLLRYGKQLVLFDAGDGVAWQLAKAGVPLGDIHTIIISHLHFDHTGGLFALLSQRYQSIQDSPVTIYGPPGITGLVNDLVDAMKASTHGANNMRGFVPGAPGGNLKIVVMDNGFTDTIGALTVKAVRNTHFSATKGGNAPDAVSLSFRVDMPGKAMLYTGDTGPSDAVERAAKGVNLLVSEIMDPDISMKRVFASAPNAPQAIKDMISEHFHKEHLSPEEVGKLAASAGVGKLVLTHDALPDEAIPGARKKIMREYSGTVTFAKDLETFKF